MNRRLALLARLHPRRRRPVRGPARTTVRSSGPTSFRRAPSSICATARATSRSSAATGQSVVVTGGLQWRRGRQSDVSFARQPGRQRLLRLRDVAEQRKVRRRRLSRPPDERLPHDVQPLPPLAATRRRLRRRIAGERRRRRADRRRLGDGRRHVRRRHGAYVERHRQRVERLGPARRCRRRTATSRSRRLAVRRRLRFTCTTTNGSVHAELPPCIQGAFDLSVANGTVTAISARRGAGLAHAAGTSGPDRASTRVVKMRAMNGSVSVHASRARRQCASDLRWHRSARGIIFRWQPLQRSSSSSWASHTHRSPHQVRTGTERATLVRRTYGWSSSASSSRCSASAFAFTQRR